MWQLGKYRAVSAHPKWFEAAYDACCFLGARRKAQTIAANSELILKLQAKCHHLHDSDEWRRTDRCATAAEKEYTAHFAFAVSIIISLWAVTHRGVRMFVPRPISPLSAGSRQGWCKLGAAATRQQAMVPMGLRLGLLSPRSSPGSWYPEHAVRDRLPCRICVGDHSSPLQFQPTRGCIHDVESPEPADLYIGRGEPGSDFWQPSPWANPFPVRKFGRGEALRHYEEHVRSSPLFQRLQTSCGQAAAVLLPGASRVPRTCAYSAVQKRVPAAACCLHWSRL